MIAELLTTENDSLLTELLESSAPKPHDWAIDNDRPDSLVRHLSADIGRAVEAGGIAKSYIAGGQMLGLCVASPDDFASREIRARTYHIRYLLATGKPEAQTLVKSLLVRDTMREVGGRTCYVAHLPTTDLAGINALERMGFSATQTALTLARDLDHYEDASVSRPYEVHEADPNEVDGMLRATATQIPGGLLGWDLRLPRAVSNRVYGDWLRTYASSHSLLVASHDGNTVGLLAEHVRADTTGTLGFDIGSVDLVATAPEYRNNGVVPQLMTDTLADFRQRGVRIAEVTTCATEFPIIRYCQRQGFLTVENTLILTNWRN